MDFTRKQKRELLNDLKKISLRNIELVLSEVSHSVKEYQEQLINDKYFIATFRRYLDLYIVDGVESYKVSEDQSVPIFAYLKMSEYIDANILGRY